MQANASCSCTFRCVEHQYMVWSEDNQYILHYILIQFRSIFFCYYRFFEEFSGDSICVLSTIRWMETPLLLISLSLLLSSEPSDM